MFSKTTRNFLPIAKGKGEMIMGRCYCICKGRACCFTCANSTCNTARLLQDIISPIHDKELDEASKQINQILDSVRAYNQDPERELALLSIPEEQSDGTVLLLAWVNAGVSVDSSVDEFKKVLQ